MIHEIKVNSWEEFQEEIKKIRSETQGSNSILQFRGQADYAWSLKTTLERRSEGVYSFSDYYKIVHGIHPEIQSFTSKNWDIVTLEDDLKWCKDPSVFNIPTPDGTTIPAYDFIAHLRHNGFPSPLLDWTYSPYVAAYFAFSQAKVADVAIYVFCEKPQNLKTHFSKVPQVIPLSKFVKTHARHFRQQSTYTICSIFNFIEQRWEFVPHQTVFELVDSESEFPFGIQDTLWKIKIPSSERIKVLKILDEYNLNDYSLFGSEESLMQTLSFREIDARSERSFD